MSVLDRTSYTRDVTPDNRPRGVLFFYFFLKRKRRITLYFTVGGPAAVGAGRPRACRPNGGKNTFTGTRVLYGAARRRRRGGLNVLAGPRRQKSSRSRHTRKTPKPEFRNRTDAIVGVTRRSPERFVWVCPSRVRPRPVRGEGGEAGERVICIA